MAHHKGNQIFVIFLAIVGLSLNLAPFFLKPPGSVRVNVSDAVFSSDLAGRELSLISTGSGALAKGSIIALNGKFTCLFDNLKYGDAEFSVSVPNFDTSAPQKAVLKPTETVEIDFTINPLFGKLVVKAMDASVEGRILSHAETGIKGKNISFTVQKDRSWAAEVMPGIHTVEIAAQDYCPQEREVEINKGKITDLIAPLSRKIDSRVELMRIMLDWGPNPRDLDAGYTVGEKDDVEGRNSIWHDYFEIKSKSGKVLARLDVDNRNSEGVETVTVFGAPKSTAHYFVNHFEGDGDLQSSGAMVEVITADCKKETFKVPQGSSGKYWHVFDLTPDMRVIPANRCMNRLPNNWNIPVKIDPGYKKPPK